MGPISEKLENIFSAVAFAEAGEYETAQEIISVKPNQNKGVTSNKKSTESLVSHGVIHNLPLTES